MKDTNQSIIRQKLKNMVNRKNKFKQNKLRNLRIRLIGRMTGIEPANDGITTHWRNRLPTSACNMLIRNNTYFYSE